MPQVRVLGGLEKAFGGRTFDLPAAGIDELVGKLAEKGGTHAAALLCDHPSGPTPALHQDLRVLVNGRNIEFLDKMATGLSEEDTVTIYCHGGRGYPGG